MKPLLMRILIISWMIIFLASCSLSTTKGLLERSPNRVTVSNTYFANPKKDYIYKAKLNIYDHNLGGILIIKKIKSEHYRIVFTTEFGNKIFDLDHQGNVFKVKYIVDNLNKDFIVKTLHNDFHLLVNQNNLVEKEFISSKEFIYQIKPSNFYFYSKSNNQLSKIVMASKNQEKLTIEFNDVNQDIANYIKLTHHNFKMNINLSFINN